MLKSFFERHRDKIAFAGPDECWLWTAGRFQVGYGMWCVLANGRAVGWNENPASGWSFPVVKA